MRTRGFSQCFSLCSCLLAMLTLLVTSLPAAAKSDFQRYGDIFQFVIPLTGLTVSLVRKDREGTWMLVKGVATSTATVHTLKFAAGRFRPGSSSEQNSFPSGHTQAAFSGAAFLQTRYGYAWGVPAYLLAAAVGASRIDARRHFTDDVIGGAGIAMMSNWYFTDRYDPNKKTVQVLPWWEEKSRGLMFTARF